MSRFRSSIAPVLFLSLVLLLVTCKPQPEYSVLIITGQGSHAWKATSEALSRILEVTGLFSVDVAESPVAGGDMNIFNPDFRSHDLVVLNYDGDPWPDATKTAFVEFVRSGGGVIVYHGASIAFPDWKEYNEITGLGGWAGRNEQSGPFCYWAEGAMVKDTTPGEAGFHEEVKDFLITHREPDHPVLKGLPDRWLHASDELYAALRGPAYNLTILATAYSDTTTGGTGRDEPVLFTILYGSGRVFHTTLGHCNEESDKLALECAGFITLFQRGAEWAASGQVTQPVPEDLPNAVSRVLWENVKALSLEELMERIAAYETGRSRKYLSDLSGRIRNSDGTPESLLRFEREMVKLLESEATADSKNYICRELSWMGSGYCIPVLQGLTTDPAVADMAKFALNRLQN